MQHYAKCFLVCSELKFLFCYYYNIVVQSTLRMIHETIFQVILALECLHFVSVNLSPEERINFRKFI